jgi:hypothetical protein
MRIWTPLSLMLLIANPVYAQAIGSTSGSMAVINSSEPASTTSRVISAPTVVAPGLAAAGVETCLGSATGGFSAMGGGFTFGTTTVDEGCTIRLLARQLYAFGFQRAALALMCEDTHVIVAMYAAGSPCPRPPPATATQPAPHSFTLSNDPNTLGDEPSPRSSFATATELTPEAAPSEPSRRAPTGEQNLRFFFASIFEPSPISGAPERRVRENGID